MPPNQVLPLALALLAGLPAAGAQNPSERPNVLLIVVDDLGVDKLAAYDPPPQQPPIPEMPTISALAAAGVLFENAWSYPLCSPSRALLLTGRYGFRNGMGTLHKPDDPTGALGPLSLEELLLPELLDRAETGYGHAAFGKWHLGHHESLGPQNDPDNPGFGWFVGTEGNLDPRTMPPQAFDFWPKTVNGATAMEQAYLTTDTVDEALSWMLSKGEEPWFCQVAFNAVHSPHHRPPGFNLPNPMPGADEDVWPYLHAMMQSVDSEVARLLQAYQLASPERFALTTVVLTGDNGSSGYGWGGGTAKPLVFPPFDRERAKGTLYEGGIHVPLIVAGFGVEAPGSRSKALVSLVDVFATVAEIAGIDLADPGMIEPERTLDSVSFWPQVQDPEVPGAREFVYSEIFVPNNFTAWPVERLQRAVRDARYKLIRREYGEPKEELFDLLIDPFELENLLEAAADSEQVAAAHARLLSALAAHAP